MAQRFKAICISERVYERKDPVNWISVYSIEEASEILMHGAENFTTIQVNFDWRDHCVEYVKFDL